MKKVLAILTTTTLMFTSACGNTAISATYCEIGMDANECIYHPITVITNEVNPPDVLKGDHTFLLKSYRRTQFSSAGVTSSWWFVPDENTSQSLIREQLSVLVRKGILNDDFCRNNAESFLCGYQGTPVEKTSDQYSKEVSSLIMKNGWKRK